jgi:hypothetical protein
MRYDPNDWYMFPSGTSKFKIVDYDACHNQYTLHYEMGTSVKYSAHKLYSIKLVSKGDSNMATDTLYEVDGKFAKKLAVNSSGMWVMEEKGSGTVFTADKKNCQEVVPYTVEVRFTQNFGESKGYHYTSVEGRFNVGDLLWMPCAGQGEGFARVVAVGTKSRLATKELEPIGRFVLEKP